MNLSANGGLRKRMNTERFCLRYTLSYCTRYFSPADEAPLAKLLFFFPFNFKFQGFTHAVLPSPQTVRLYRAVWYL